MVRWNRRFAALGSVALIALVVSCGGEPEPEVFAAERPAMGTTFEIRLVSRDRVLAATAIREAFLEVDRVERLLSEWRDDSEISKVNRQAGRQPVRVGPELFTVLERAVWAFETTDGAFDTTFAACGHLWSIRDRRIPGPDAIARCLTHVGTEKIRLDRRASTVFLPEEGMRIGIAGIGKGYGVDRAAAMLEARGIADYIVNGGGDIRLRGSRMGAPWHVGIRHPRRPERLAFTIEVPDGAVVTSGDYENFFEVDGIRYHHILDPRTGRPARASVAVTVIAPTAMDADALATGLFVLGPERGEEIVEGLDGVEALWFGPDLRVTRSSGFPRTVEVSPDANDGDPGQMGPPDSPMPVDASSGPG